MNKSCQAILSILKFMKAKMKKEMCASEVDKMTDNVKALYASIARTLVLELHDPPSLNEQRERGEALSFLDIVKVCEGQHWRVKTLSNFGKRNRQLSERLKKAVKLMLLKKVQRLAVLFTLLKYPTRKIEAQRSIIEKLGAHGD